MNFGGWQGPHAAFPAVWQRCNCLVEMSWARDITRIAALRLMLAAVLLLQASLSATAMARMDAAQLAPDGGFVETVICTADGIKTVQLPSGTPENNQHQGCDCPCAALCAAFSASSLAPAVAGGQVGLATHSGGPTPPLGTSRELRSSLKERPGSPRSPPFAA